MVVSYFFENFKKEQYKKYCSFLLGYIYENYKYITMYQQTILKERRSVYETVRNKCDKAKGVRF